MAEPDPPREEAGPEFARGLFDSLVLGTRLGNELPTAEQRGYAETFPPFNQAMALSGGQLSGMISGFMGQQAQQAAAERFGQLEDASDRFESVVGLSDRLLERVDSDLDAARGLKNHAVVDAAGAGGGGGGALSCTASAASAPQQQTPARRPAAASAMSAGSAARPQMRWRGEVDNSDEPFLPKLRAKPNALVPLQLVLTSPQEEDDEPGGGGGGGRRRRAAPHYANPYEHELADFQPDEAQLSPPAAERLYAALQHTPCHWVG